MKSIRDSRGELIVAEEGTHVPFKIARVFFVETQRKGTVRGDHAHKSLYELVLCTYGSLDIEVMNGISQKTYRLDNPAIGLLIPPMVWVRVKTTTTRTRYLVLASHKYQEADYFRDFEQFLTLTKARNEG